VRGSTIPVITLIALSALCAQTSPPPEFEVASIRRSPADGPWFWGPHRNGRWTATNANLKRLTSLAWRTPLFAITGGPSWIENEGYDISAREPHIDTSDDDFLLMLQNLLKNRFALKTHTEMRVQPVYVLAPAKSGLKLPEATPEPCATFALKPGAESASDDRRQPCGGMNVVSGLISDDKVSMAWFISVLEGLLGRRIVNKTGFAGSFRLHLEFVPLDLIDYDGPMPSLFAALQEQLGLKLEGGRDEAEILVIDRAERPTEN